MNDTALHLVCEHCGAVNRVPQQRLQESPKCGRCHQPILEGSVSPLYAPFGFRTTSKDLSDTQLPHSASKLSGIVFLCQGSFRGILLLTIVSKDKVPIAVKS